MVWTEKIINAWMNKNDGPCPQQSICYSDCTTVSHRGLESEQNTAILILLQRFALWSWELLLILATWQLKNSKTPSYFKTARMPPLQNNTFTKTTTGLEFPLCFRQANTWSMEFPWTLRLSLKQVKSQDLKGTLYVPFGCVTQVHRQVERNNGAVRPTFSLPLPAKLLSQPSLSLA